MQLLDRELGAMLGCSGLCASAGPLHKYFIMLFLQHLPLRDFPNPIETLTSSLGL